MYLCSHIGIQRVLRDWLLENAPHLMLYMCFIAEDATLRVASQIAARKCVHCQNLHVDTTPTTITSRYNCKFSISSKNWYKSQVVSGHPLTLLGIKMVHQQQYISNLSDAKTTTTVKKSRYDKICDQFPDVFKENSLLPNQTIEHEIQLKDPTWLIPHPC